MVENVLAETTEFIQTLLEPGLGASFLFHLLNSSCSAMFPFASSKVSQKICFIITHPCHVNVF